jgi:hypothetical protein
MTWISRLREREKITRAEPHLYCEDVTLYCEENKMSHQMSLCTIDFGNQTAPHVLRSCHASTTLFYNNITIFLKITKKPLSQSQK